MSAFVLLAALICSGRVEAVDYANSCFFSQSLNLDLVNAAEVSSVPLNVLVLENFSSHGEPIGTIEWIGAGAALLGETALPCSLAGASFQLLIHSNVNNAPGLIYYDEIITPNFEPLDETVRFLGVDLPLYRFQANLSREVVLFNGWVSISRADGGGCEFLWVQSPDGDQYSYRGILNFLNPASVDYTLCLSPAEAVEPVDELAIKARQLLEIFSTADTNESGTLGVSEAQLSGIGLFRTEFFELDLNGNNQVNIAELHARAGLGVVHTADTNGNKRFDLPELMRLIQIYNTGGYRCAPSPGDTEDGFEVSYRGARGVDNGCAPNDSDYQGVADGQISLGELLRALQLYNLGGHYDCGAAGEDGFCAQESVISPDE
ncbi:MAG: hypothetical protein GC168_04015 [Candidatus Hydrogenedens sp.]|nr:hypothetical protein [Candidatus Hydrogenedens sp.]